MIFFCRSGPLNSRYADVLRRLRLPHLIEPRKFLLSAKAVAKGEKCKTATHKYRKKNCSSPFICGRDGAQPDNTPRVCGDNFVKLASCGFVYATF